MWQATIKKLGPRNLAVLGLVQEQHAERTRLYKQWKQYDFHFTLTCSTFNNAALVAKNFQWRDLLGFAEAGRTVFIPSWHSNIKLSMLGVSYQKLIEIIRETSRRRHKKRSPLNGDLWFFTCRKFRLVIDRAATAAKTNSAQC